MYLPNPDLHPTGFEPAEYIDVPPVQGGASVGPFERLPPVPLATSDGALVDQRDLEGSKRPSSERQPWFARVAAMTRRTRQAISSPAYYLGRPAARWRRAMHPRTRR